MGFSCYSENEGMEPCTQQCEYCRVNFHPLPHILKPYALNIKGKRNTYNIQVTLPANLLHQLYKMKQQDPKAFDQTLLNIIKRNF